MKNDINTELQQITLAQNTNDENLLKQLSDSIYLSVRRCVARNSHTSSEIVDKLSTDCSLNVSFVANQNSKCTSKRVITSKHPCIICTVDEKDYHKACNNCNLIKNRLVS